MHDICDTALLVNMLLSCFFPSHAFLRHRLKKALHLMEVSDRRGVFCIAESDMMERQRT